MLIAAGFIVIDPDGEPVANDDCDYFFPSVRKAREVIQDQLADLVYESRSGERFTMADETGWKPEDFQIYEAKRFQ